MANAKLSLEESRGLIMEAARLLTDTNLVWSNDLNEIRPHLTSLLIKALGSQELQPLMIPLAAKLVSLS